MDNTLDTIRASDATIPEEVSYLYGRDPSILAYGQQRFISKESQKNLYSLYEEEELNNGTTSDSLSAQTIKVYLRMKPFPRKMKLLKNQEEAYTIINSTTLFTKLPNMEHNASCLKRPKSSDTLCKKFTFTQTFGPETTQYDLFEQAIRPQMIDFLAGQNATVMTYGTTNSGKSYTLQGTTSSPGIIPRGLEFVFSNISPKSTPCYKPLNHSDVIALDSQERALELDIKTNLLTFGSLDKNQYISAYKQMQKLLQEESPIRPSECTDAHYSVWVSFAEIYNETIYDLLSNGVQSRRPALKLATDSHGRAFIKGLKTVCVNSGSEAYQVLMAGQYNLKVAATALNARSSRSHCIFTVTLLKYFCENKPESVEISTFAFCDLAGSERLKKTLNEGDRLKEAQNINTSLLVLGRCLKSIYETQGTKQKQTLIGPFRESKLTRLFQKALSGHENIALIVNVNPIPNLYVETQNVLNFSAIAKKIVIEPRKTSRKKSSSRFSKIVTQSIKTVTDWDIMELENIEETDSEFDQESDIVHRDDFEELFDENRKLKQEIATLKNSALERDMKIRQELADTYSEMIKQVEDDWRKRVKDVEEQQEDHLEYSLNRLEEFYKEKINHLSSRKRMRSDLENDIEDDDQKNCEELEEEVAYLNSKLKNMKETIISLREQKEKEIVEKTKISFDLSLVKDELKKVKMLLQSANEDMKDEGGENYIKELKTQLSSEQEKNKQLKIFLNEAKEDYIAITNDGRHMEKKLKEKEELLIEYEDKMMELEQQLETINACFAEKVKISESLEDKIDMQNKLIADLEDDVLNLKEKQRVQRNIMHSEKETMTTPEKDCIKHTETKVEVREESCQTFVSSFSNEEVQTDNMIKTEGNFYTEDKNLQTSLLDISQQERIEELEELKGKCAELEREAETKNTELTNKIEELKNTITKCREEHEATKNEMQNYKNKEEFKSQFLEDYQLRVIHLETELKEAEDFRKVIKEMNVALEKYESEKAELQKLLEDAEKKCSSLETQLEKAAKDKEAEIKSLQKEVKELIQARSAYEESQDRENEKQIKSTLKTLRATEEALSEEQEKSKKLQKQKERLEKDVLLCKETIENLNIIEEKDRQLQDEIRELKESNNALRNEILQKQIEFEKFSAHRDETITRYECLVNNLQEDVEREKKEKTRLQELFQKHPTPSKDELSKLRLQLEDAFHQIRSLQNKNAKEMETIDLKPKKIRQRRDKENYDNTSEDEAPHSQRKRRSPRIPKPSPIPTNEGSIIEVSSNESKRQTRTRAALGPPDILPISDKKKTNTRRKKLFQQETDGCIDLEPCEVEPTPAPSPLTSIRNLRTRRK